MRSLTILAGSFVFTLLAINATLAPSAFCAGPDWVLIDEGKDSSFFFDKSGTSKPEVGIVRVKTRVIYTEQGKADAQKILSTAKYLATLYESRYIHDLNCIERESHLLEATHLDKDGATLKSTKLGGVTEWEGIPPETPMSMVFEKVCP
jgi:hypothetical protein